MTDAGRGGREEGRDPSHAVLGPTRAEVLRTAWPLILANASAPLLGLADTAVIGNTGSVADLGAIALGALILNFVYWAFGFLRMGTTGFVAQAVGAGDEAEVRAGLARPLLLGAGIGVLIVLLQWPIERASLGLLEAGPEVEAITAEYVRVRIWGAPACLATYALMGALIGLGASRQLLAVQVFLNGINIALDVLFAGVLDMGAVGVALGTAIAEWTSLGLALWLVSRVIRRRARSSEPFLAWSRILDRSKLREMFSAHADILVRTLLLLGGFAWFTSQGAKFGDATLASNHLLLQLVSFSAFFLDGFAFAAEALVGRAKGAADLAAFDRAVWRTTELAVVAGLLLAAAILVFGGVGVDLLTDLPAVREIARDHLTAAVVYVALSAWAFQLDGVFIGVTRTKAMRNAAFASLVGFLALSWLLIPAYGNHGLWIAFIAYVVLRALSLGVLLPALRRSLATEPK